MDFEVSGAKPFGWMLNQMLVVEERLAAPPIDHLTTLRV